MPPGLSYATLRIVVVVGDALPWRIVESVANSMRPGAYRRKMFYFRTAEQARRSVRERIEWRLADKRFARQNMNTPGDFPASQRILCPGIFLTLCSGRCEPKCAPLFAQLYRNAQLQCRDLTARP